MKPTELTFHNGIKSGLPIFIGYFPMAMAFGLLAKNGSIPFITTTAFSVLVFAGASQFMAIQLLTSGVAAIEIILATFLLNFRHLLMSASIAPHLKNTRKRWFPFVAFGITDETFAVASMMQEQPNIKFLLGLEITAYSGWIGGTICGYLIGSSLPPSIQASMGITLYAMFIAILIPQFKTSSKTLFLALGSGLIHTLLVIFKLLPRGWSLIAAMVISALMGAFLFKEGEEKLE